MIQAVADDEERGALGMHYTSVPNILKVLNPLFLNDLLRNWRRRRQRAEAVQPTKAYRRDSGLRPRMRLRQLLGDRVQGNACHRG